MEFNILRVPLTARRDRICSVELVFSPKLIPALGNPQTGALFGGEAEHRAENDEMIYWFIKCPRLAE